MTSKVYEIGEFDSRRNVGVVTSTNTLIKYLRRLDIEIEYFTYDNMPKKKIFKLHRLLSPRAFSRIKLTRDLVNYWAIRTFQEVGKEDILHIHNFGLLPHFLQSLNIPKKVVLTFYGTAFGIIGVENGTNPYYLRAILNIPDVIIVGEVDKDLLLEKARRYFPGNEKALKRKMAIFPHIGIDDEIFDPERVEPHKWYEPNINKEGLIVFKGGAISKWKGDSILIKIADEVLSKRKDIYFVWAGYFRSYPFEEQAALKSALMRLCKKYPKNAFYIGKYHYSDLPALLKGADVIPHLFKIDGGGLSTFGREALMMGRYVLATNVGWYKDFIGDSKGFHILDWKDDNKLIQEAIDEFTYLADNLNETRNRGSTNRIYAAKYCSAKVSAKQHLMIYKALSNNEPLPTTEELLSISRKHAP
jgi:glycosyltransferase involved in cell wall biosynthesis